MPRKMWVNFSSTNQTKFLIYYFHVCRFYVFSFNRLRWTSTDTDLFKDLKNQNAELIYVFVEKCFITIFLLQVVLKLKYYVF